MESYKKGTSFEIELALYLSKFEGVRVITNVKAYSPQLKRITPIDLVVLSPWGYFCIEAKDYRSQITGKLDEPMWWYRSWGKSWYKVNPVNQNTIHTIALSRAIYLRTKQQILFDNLVVVSDSCVLETDAPNVLSMSDFMLFMERSFNLSNKNMEVEGLYKIIMKMRGA